jgi:hypothetical protein
MSEKDVIMETAKMLSNYNGQLLNNTQIKKQFGSAAGGSDICCIINTHVFLITFKWDNGTMSANNTILFLNACNIIEKAVIQTTTNYKFYKVIISKKQGIQVSANYINIHLNNTPNLSPQDDVKYVLYQLYTYINSMIAS